MTSRRIRSQHSRVFTNAKDAFMRNLTLKAATLISALSLISAVATTSANAAETMKGKLQAYFDAVNKGNVTEALAFWSPNAAVEDPYGTVLKIPIHDFLKDVISKGLKYEVISPLRGTNAIAANLKVSVPEISVNAIAFYEFDKTGRIVKMQAFWGPEDTSTPAKK